MKNFHCPLPLSTNQLINQSTNQRLKKAICFRQEVLRLNPYHVY